MKMKASVLALALCGCVALAAAETKIGADGFPQASNTYFRPQEAMISSDASKEADIPGLTQPDVKAVQRAIPNLENMAPLLTMLSPLLPVMKPISDAMGIFFPRTWDLATTGPQGDWLKTTLVTTFAAFLGKGPRPYTTMTVLVPSPEAYQKLQADLQAYSGLKADNTTDPLKRASVTKAVVTQLARNLYVPAADSNLTNAVNGTQMVTYGDVLLTLVVKDDGSRWLVSNTTSVKLVKADIPCGGLTIQVVDGFIVPAMQEKAPKKQLITQKDIDNLHETFRLWSASLRQVPLALRSMPKNLQLMVTRQLPDKQAAAVEAVVKRVEEAAAALPKLGGGRRML